jgi:hypothetical protein
MPPHTPQAKGQRADDHRTTAILAVRCVHLERKCFWSHGSKRRPALHLVPSTYGDGSFMDTSPACCFLRTRGAGSGLIVPWATLDWHALRGWAFTKALRAGVATFASSWLIQRMPMAMNTPMTTGMTPHSASTNSPLAGHCALPHSYRSPNAKADRDRRSAMESPLLPVPRRVARAPDDCVPRRLRG